MANSIVRRHTPWLDYPLVFSGNYREYECGFNDTAQCEFQTRYWVFWYEADHRYALPTVALFLATIILFSLVYIAGAVLPGRVLKAPVATKARAIYRYLSYRMVRVPFLDWNSAPVGILLLGAVGAIFFFCMTLGPKPYYWPNTAEVDYGSSPPIATRTGWMSLACLPFIFATAGKSNLISYCTGVSYERLQVFHRWISYACFVLALIHTFPFIVYNFQTDMMADMWNSMIFYWTGVVALLAQAWLTFASVGPLRNLCYEWFKFSHFVAGLVFMLFLFFHCDATLTAWDYFAATGVLYALSWLYRQIRVYCEHGVRHRAELSLAPNGFIRVGVPVKTTWAVGQHYFVRFMTLGMHAWTIHPFSACSLPGPHPSGPPGASELVFYIRPRGGFTARLARFVGGNPDAKVRVLLDGPYGGVESRAIQDSQRMLVVAGGAGAGWVFPFVTAFAQKLEKSGLDEAGGVQPSLRVVLVTRDALTTSWFEAEVRRLLNSLPALKSRAVEIEIYYTGSPANKEDPRGTGQFVQAPEDLEKLGGQVDVQSAPASASDSNRNGGLEMEQVASNDALSVGHFEARPDLQAIVRQEAGLVVGSGQNLGVFLCGPLGMQSEVSNAVAAEQLQVAKRGTGDIHLHLEHFSWA